MVAPVEVGEGGVELLVGNGLLKHTKQQTVMRSGQRISRRGSNRPGAMAHGPWNRVKALRQGLAVFDGDDPMGRRETIKVGPVSPHQHFAQVRYR
jgi:hypothetical protein